MVKKRYSNNSANRVRLSNLTFHKLDWLEYVTLILAAWFLFYPKPYVLLFTVLLIIPILGLLLNGLSGRPSIASLVAVSPDRDGGNNYDVADFIDIAALILGLRVLLDYEFENFYSLIIPGTIAFLLMLLILFTTHRLIEQSRKSKTWIYLSLILNILLYSFAGTYGANCVYDLSEPTPYKAEVVGKRISGSKRTTYYIKVTPWGHHYDREEISVSKAQYTEIEIGQSITIDLKKGLFNIPWYYVKRQAPTNP